MHHNRMILYFITILFDCSNFFVIKKYNQTNSINLATSADFHLPNHELKITLNESINDKILDAFKSLKHLTIFNTDLKYLDQKLFNNLQELESLFLFKNTGFLRLNEKTFKKCTSLKELNIRGNEHLILKNGALKSLKNLEVICADNQTIQNSENSYFRGSLNLKYIKFFNGVQKTISSLSFYKMSNLETVVLTKMQIEKIEDSAFSDLPKLKILILHDNKLTRFSGKELADVLNLEILNLERNFIVRFEAEVILRRLPNLRMLKLSKNKIGCIDKLNINKCLTKNYINDTFDKDELIRCDNLSYKVQIFSS